MNGQDDRKLLLNCTREQAVILIDYDERHTVNYSRDSFVMGMSTALLNAQ